MNHQVRIPHDWHGTGFALSRGPNGVLVTPILDPDVQDGDPAQTITLSRGKALRMAWTLAKLACGLESPKETTR